MIKDELDLDGRPNLNLASFVGTYMEKQAEELMIENLSKARRLYLSFKKSHS